MKQASSSPVGVLVVVGVGGSSDTDSENGLVVQLASTFVGAGVCSTSSEVVVSVIVTARAWTELASAEASANAFVEVRMLIIDYEKDEDKEIREF